MSEQSHKMDLVAKVFYWLMMLIVIALFVAIAIPNRAGSHTSPANACINNMRQIDAAANQFALENHLTNGNRINFPNDLTPYIKLNRYNKIPPCPSGGIYFVQKVGSIPICSLGYTVTPAHVLP